MNYDAMRYVAEVCQVQGAGRAILWAIAYRADHQHGECWAGQRRIAREAGVARSTVQRLLPELLEAGELELILKGSGPGATCYAIVGTDASGPTTGPVGGPTTGPVAPELVDRSGEANGPIRGELVDRSGYVTGPFTSPLSSENASQGFNQVEKQGEVQGRNAAGSAADAAGGVAGGVSPDLEAAIRQLDPDAIRDPGGWNLSDEAPGGRGWLRDRDAARWVAQQQRGAAS